MNGSQRSIFVVEKLPYDYEVEWLQRSGNQHIDTGVKPYNTTRFVTKVYNIQYGGAFFGCRVAQNNRGFYGLLANENSSLVLYVALGDKVAELRDLLHNGENITFEINRDKVYVNNELVYVSPTKNYNTADINIMLFNLKQYNTNIANLSTTVRLGSTQIYQNDVLVRDFIPVVKDGVGYMYDKVEEKFYANLGNGQFTIGPKI